MQESFIASPTWTHTALGLLAALLTGGGIVQFYNSWLNRRKPAAEVQVTEATATEIKVRANASASDAVMRMMDKLSDAQSQIDDLRIERDAALLKAAKAEDDAEAQRIFVMQLNAAARLTVCEHHPTGVKLSDFTPHELNPPK